MNQAILQLVSICLTVGIMYYFIGAWSVVFFILFTIGIKEFIVGALELWVGTYESQTMAT